MQIETGVPQGSKEVCRAAVMMCLSEDRAQEKRLADQFAKRDLHCAAVDFGGEFIASVMKIVERSVVAAKREGIIGPQHNEEGAVAGATREAISQITSKAIGLNVGGKIGIARSGEHVAVAIFFGIGLLHLNEIALGLGHRVI